MSEPELEVKPASEMRRGSTVENIDSGMENRQFLVPIATDVPDVRLVGDRVIIAADVDMKGLRKLRRQLAMFEQMLSMGDEDDEPTEKGKGVFG